MARSYASRTDRRAQDPGAPAPERVFAPTAAYPDGLFIGLDVGSMTVKAVVADPETDAILWSDYRRHGTRQVETCLDFLESIAAAFPDLPDDAFRLFVTGSGGGGVASMLGARFVQEVNAVVLAVEKLYPDVNSVVELGGQDAKIIVFSTDPKTGARRKFASMNDKCAGGTGAVIDKIAAKLGISLNEAAHMGYDGIRIHPVAGKCGVFAETDINGLQKQGVPPDELMASLFESLVQQNLSVLTRGHTLRPRVLLLGGPNCFIRGLAECWRANIPEIWRERDIALPDGAAPSDLITVPENAQFFAALGAIEHGKRETREQPNLGVYGGADPLRWYLSVGRREEKLRSGEPALVRDAADRDAFVAAYTTPSWSPPRIASAAPIDAYLGLDGGSTSTKAVLVDRDRRILAKAYQLSRGNPIEDTKEVLRALDEQVSESGGRVRIAGAATTGYAKDILKDVIGADAALVETVAHAQSGMHYYPDADVICDVGGQDIKIIVLKNGAVKDFRLNTQCSAGNGYYLQATAESFGVPVEAYAETAFTAETMPQFGYGCAVFLQADIVDFQRKGWQSNEILAGLAAVLPKNIWLYVCQIPNPAKLGTTFVLQGGTQRNLAAVKAQVDFLEERFRETGQTPRIHVHAHCGESGAIGCAFEVQRMHAETGFDTTFIGFDAVQSIRYRMTRDERTRCSFCKNCCMRTFIDVRTEGPGEPERVQLDAHPYRVGAQGEQPSRIKHAPDLGGKRQSRTEAVPLEPGEERLIIATCEKGTVEDVDDMRAIKRELDAVKKANPSLAELASRLAFSPVKVDPVPSQAGRLWRSSRRARLVKRRGELRIGMPRVLNLHSLAPFFMGCFQSLGIPGDRIVWSDPTGERMFRDGAKRGSVDPCYPSKVCIPHVHNLLFEKHRKRPLTHIFFPMIDAVPPFVACATASRACPTSTATPEAVHAAFIKEGDVFERAGIVFKKTLVSLDQPGLCARQLAEDWADELGVTERESARAVEQGLRALQTYQQRLRAEGRALLETIEREDRLGIVLLARSYHGDPGINHGICEEFQKLGYPVFTPESLPTDPDILDRLFGDDLAAGRISHPLSIEDVWGNSYSENSSRKLWAAKFAARHPNLVALELSSFKCGMDAPIYTTIEQIIEQSETPFFYFRDIDENKPRGSIRIRIETIAYFLRRYHERLLSERMTRAEIEARLQAYEERLRRAFASDDDSVAVA